MDSQIVLTEKVRHVGTFDFKKVYKFLYEWLAHKNYIVDEKEYKELIGPGGAKEIDITWVAYRNISGYFRYTITFYYKIIGLVPVEVEIDGVKHKMNKGDLEIKEICALVHDYKDQWTSPFFRFWKYYYEAYIMYTRIDKYEKDVLAELEELFAETKAFLQLTGKR